MNTVVGFSLSLIVSLAANSGELRSDEDRSSEPAGRATVPVDFAFPNSVTGSVLTIALNNSYLWMKEMPFMDPEASADPGTGAQQGYNFEETVPAPIQIHMSLRITF